MQANQIEVAGCYRTADGRVWQVINDLMNSGTDWVTGQLLVDGKLVHLAYERVNATTEVEPLTVEEAVDATTQTQKPMQPSTVAAILARLTIPPKYSITTTRDALRFSCGGYAAEYNLTYCNAKGLWYALYRCHRTGEFV